MGLTHGSVAVVGGIQMIFFGILGEYTGRTSLKVGNKHPSAVRVVLNPDARSEAGPVEQEASYERIRTDP
jgi:hypothetical protein